MNYLNTKHSFKTATLVTAMAVSTLLTACGGGGGSSSSEPIAPIASATAPTIAAPVMFAAPVIDAGTLSTAITPSVYVAGSAQAYIYESVNAIRLAGGFGTVTQNILLDKAAQAQADYATANYILPQGGWDYQTLQAIAPTGSLFGHSQIQGKPLFIGANSEDRANHFGYKTTWVGEVGAFNQSPRDVAAKSLATNSVAGWLTSFRHRQHILDPMYREIGTATSVSATYDNPTASEIKSYAQYLEPAYGTVKNRAPTGWIGVYPYVDEVNTQTRGYHYTTGQVGFGVSLAIGQGTLVVESFTLTKIVGAIKQAVPVKIFTHINDSFMLSNWAVAEPMSELDVNSIFEASFTGYDNSGQKFTKVWQFTTSSISN
jgi:uncharacterized protein YkwD